MNNMNDNNQFNQNQFNQNQFDQNQFNQQPPMGNMPPMGGGMPPMGPPPGQEPGHQFGVISLILGICSLALPWIFTLFGNSTLNSIISLLCIACAIVGIVMASKARKANMTVGLPFALSVLLQA